MGGKWEQWQTSFSWAPKSLWTMTAARKLRHLFFEKISMTNLDNVLKNRDITLPTKVHIVKVMVFSVVMYGCESWTIKKAECQRIDAFELWCWRRLLVPSTARRIFLVPSIARHHVAHQSPYSQSYGFFSSHVWMWELNHKEGWVPKNWCFWTIVLEKTQSLQQQGEQTSQS